LTQLLAFSAKLNVHKAKPLCFSVVNVVSHDTAPSH